MNSRLNTLGQGLGGALMLTLAACGGGGGGGDDTGGNPPPQPNTLSGQVVVDQPIRNAVVCLDVNANNACDTDEPASSPTGADGAYTISYDTAKVTAEQAARASLIAPMVPGAATEATTTIDAANPAVGNASRPYVLKQVPGKAGQINPLTTLVAAGVAAGMTEASARSNAALQLAITEAKIDNYQDDPAFDPAQIRDNARTMAQVVALALQDGATLQVLDQNAQLNAAAGELAGLTYTDSANFDYRTLDVLDKPAGVTGARLRDNRGGAGMGSPLLPQFAYTQAYLTPAGWLRCDANVVITTTRGNPSRSTFCNALAAVNYRVSSENISGRPMTSVVSAMAVDPAANTITPSAALAGALGAATFPAGSSTTLRRSFNLNQPAVINLNSTNEIRPPSEATLEQTIAARQASSVNLPSSGTSLNLGLGSANSKNLRVAFTGSTSSTAGTVQFYECDLDVQLNPVNCAATQTGTYAISTEGGVRVMRFAGHAATVMDNTRAYVEVKDAPDVVAGSRVFMARERKPSVEANATRSQRLNATAWAAMKQQLGL